MPTAMRDAPPPAPIPICPRCCGLPMQGPGAGGHAARQCLACHTFVKNGGDRAGPNLHAVMGRSIAGGSARYGYTDALSRVGGRWNATRMDRWLANPARFAPGTTMRFAGIADPLERADIIAYLETLSD